MVVQVDVCFPPLARPFVCGCPIISTMPHFHTPLIKPDGPFSGIRLSDKVMHTFAHGLLGVTLLRS